MYNKGWKLFVQFKKQDMKRLLLLLLLVTMYCNGLYAQGYAYVHLRAVSETDMADLPEASRAVSFGGAASFQLRDDAVNNYHIYDMGASHGTYYPQLWAVGHPTTYNNEGSHKTPGRLLFKDNANGSGWIDLLGVSLTNVLSVDGIGDRTCVFVNSLGQAFIFDNTLGTKKLTKIWEPTTTGHSSVKFVDIASGGPGGEIVAVGDNGAVYRYAGTPDAWWNYSNALLRGQGEVNALRVDIYPGSPNYVAMQSTAGNIYTFVANNININPNIVSFKNEVVANHNFFNFFDVVWADDGKLYATANVSGAAAGAGYDGVYCVQFVNSSEGWRWEYAWYGIQPLTGGPGGQIWGSNIPDITPEIKRIFSKVANGCSEDIWIDDERLKSNNSEAIMVPISDDNSWNNIKLNSLPTGWDVTDIQIFDPTGNSVVDFAQNRARLKATTNEVVHVIFTVAKQKKYAINGNCSEHFLENFGTGGTDLGPALRGLTTMHYNDVSTSTSGDGYYSRLRTLNGTRWKEITPGLNIQDHTTGAANGYFALFNASYTPEYFYYQTISNFTVNAQYELSFWVADISPTSPRRPNIEFGVRDPNLYLTQSATTDNVVSSVKTGNITSTVWRKYSFTFTPTKNELQIFLRNAAAGGDGNDLVIDDIELTILNKPDIAISGNPGTACTQNGVSSYQFTANPSGGVWSSNKPALITIGSSTGLATPVVNKSGTATITYNYTDPTTLCTNDKSLNITLDNNCTVLPITLASFTAQSNGNNSALLKWDITSAKDFSRFEVERSSNGKDFEKISTVYFDNTRSAYSYIDNQLLNGTYQYRLNMIDVDESQKYSDVKEVSIGGNAGAQAGITVAPNPARDYVHVKGANAGSIIRIMDVTGRVISEEKLINVSSPLSISKLPASTYILQVVENGTVKGVTRFVKQ